MNNADLIIATLKANGVSRGFGIPSGNVLPLMEAMRSGGVEFVLTAHGFGARFTGLDQHDSRSYRGRDNSRDNSRRSRPKWLVYDRVSRGLALA